MDWMLMPLKRYADFSGRSRRQEYWMFILGTTLFYIVSALLIGAIVAVSPEGSDAAGIVLIILIALLALAYLALIVPSLAVMVRRLHDRDMSGWLILISFIPLGGIVLLVFMCIEGTPGPNRYGPDPKNPDDHFRTVFR